jgi:SAM-dependent methyltransferase
MKETEIRPKELHRKFLNLVKNEALNFKQENLIEVFCPGCEGQSNLPVFKKDGFQYVKCSSCGTLFCSPRPNEVQLAEYQETSESSNYWSQVFSPAVYEIRKEKLFNKKANSIYKKLIDKEVLPNKICDVGAGFGVFLEELKMLFKNAAFYAIEPNKEFAERCRQCGFDTLETSAEESVAWKDRFDLVISSEVIEHVFSTRKFVKSLYDLTAENGQCLVTGLGYEGFDILTLQEHSNSIFPPHHLNFLSIKGMKTLFENVGFHSINIETPGQLDFDIVYNSEHQNEFVRVLSERGSDAISEFQSFLQKHRLSSHIWIWAKK